MNVLDRFARWVVQRAYGPTWTMGSTQTGGPFTGDAWRSERAPTAGDLAEAYRSVIYSCVNINALGVARVPLRLYATRRPGSVTRASHRKVANHERRRLASLPHLTKAIAADSEVDEIQSHPILDLLDNPTQGTTKDQLLYWSVACLDVIGQTVIVPLPDIAPEGSIAVPPTELAPCPPEDVTLNRSDSSSGPVQSIRCGSRTYDPNQVLWFKHVSLRDPYGPGYSPTQAVLSYAKLEETFVSVQSQILSSPRPSLVVSASDPRMPIGPQEGKRLEQDMNSRLSGPRAGRVFVNQTGLKLDPLSYQPSDLSGLKISEYDLQRIANAFGVPVAMLTSETNLANLQASEALHARLAVEPRCRAIASVLTRFVRRMDERLFFAFDPASKEDEERRARIFDIGLKNGTRVPNEERFEAGYDAVPWGDAPLPAAGVMVPGDTPDDAVDGMDTTGVPAGDVQATALNGAQIQAIVEVLNATAGGMVPLASARAVLIAALPTVDVSVIDQIINPLTNFEPRQPEPPEPPEQPEEPDDAEDDSEDEEQRAAIAASVKLLRTLQAQFDAVRGVGDGETRVASGDQSTSGGEHLRDPERPEDRDGIEAVVPTPEATDLLMAPGVR